MIVLTEVDACALNCGHNATVLNVGVAEVKMRRPHVQVQHCMYIEEIFLKPAGQMMHTTGSHVM